MEQTIVVEIETTSKSSALLVRRPEHPDNNLYGTLAYILQQKSIKWSCCFWHLTYTIEFQYGYVLVNFVRVVTL